jgi:dolichyldiphosphatase
MFIGQLACECINFCLKRIIREERPREMHGKGYGMPSSHAQFVSFFSVYLTLFLLLRHKGNTHPKAAHTPMSLRRRTVLCVEALGWAGAVAWSRIYLSYHTPKQVMVGALAGTICAFGWFFMTTVFRRSGLLHYALALPPVRYFRFRDLVVEEDIAQAGWEKWEERRLRAASQNGTKDKRR